MSVHQLQAAIAYSLAGYQSSMALCGISLHGSFSFVLTVRSNFSRIRCDSGFSQGLKDTSYSFYQSQNMVEIQHELLFLSIRLETTQTESYNAGTLSSNHY